MIIVTVEYNQYSFDDAALQEFSDSIEAIVGLVFAEELDRVDVRLRPFGPFDQYDEPLFITIDIEEKEMITNPEMTCQQFIIHFETHIDAYLGSPIHGKKVPFRVWVRRISGSFTDTGIR